MDCGAPARHYDHARGYTDPHVLDVEPVCTKCHGRRTGERGEMAHGEGHARAVLDAPRVRGIRALVAAGVATGELAAAYGVQPGTIRKVARRVLWKHVA